MPGLSAPRAPQGRRRPHEGNKSCLDSQDGITTGRRFGRWRVKKRKMGTHSYCGRRHERSGWRNDSNRERTNWPGSLRLGKNGVRGCMGLAAGMASRHHGAFTLLRHAVAALPFRGSHGHTRKHTRHRRRDRPYQGDRQQGECSGSCHFHQSTAFCRYHPDEVLLAIAILDHGSAHLQ